MEEHLLHQVSDGVSWRGKAAAGSIRAQLHQLCAALAQISEALWLGWNQLSPAEKGVLLVWAEENASTVALFLVPQRAYSKLVCLYLCIALNYAIAKPYLNYAVNVFQTKPVSLHPLLSHNPPYFISQEKALY